MQETLPIVGACKHCLQCRQPDGHLGSPSLCQGRLKVLDKTPFLAGQCKPVLHAELHSIRSFTEELPVTLVLRHKDKAAKGRVTTCYVPCADSVDDLDHALPTSPEERTEDRTASKIEKAAMLEVKAPGQFQKINCNAVLLLLHRNHKGNIPSSRALALPPAWLANRSCNVGA